MTEDPMLSLMILTLPVMALLIWLLPSPDRARWIALAATMVELVLAILIIVGFDPDNADFQFVERHQWMPSLNIQ